MLPTHLPRRLDLLPTGPAPKGLRPTFGHYLYYVLLLNSSGAPPSSGDLELEGTDRITVLFTDVLLDVLFEHNDRVVVLLHLAQWALYARLEPFHYALGVKDVLALELLVVPFRLLKTHSTCLG